MSPTALLYTRVSVVIAVGMTVLVGASAWDKYGSSSNPSAAQTRKD